MSYVDALKLGDTIHVVERRNGKRIFQKKPAKYVFYAKSQKGNHTSIHGDSLIRYESNNYKTFKRESSMVPSGNLVEYDIDPITRYLETHYLNEPTPDLHIVFFDIEVGFDTNRGYSSPEDPYSPVTAVSIHQSWTDELWCFATAPPTMTYDEAKAVCDKFPNTILCKTEKELFDRFFDCIEDADVLSGWNSTGFDIPYMVRRLKTINRREDTKKFCLWNQYPKERTYMMYGKENITYDLIGRVHLDYLDLYKKYTYHQLPTYKLDYVGEIEVGEKKVSYSGTLDKLYKEDFELFIKYSRQDSALLKKIDDKNKFIDLSNEMAHDSTVTISKTLGSVALIEQAINIEVHSKGLICPSKVHSKGGNKSVAGAYVANPKKGLHEWIGSVDINSLYPSVIRSLNMSPETIVGQLELTRTQQIIDNYMDNKKNATLAEAWSLFFGVEEYDMIKAGRENGYESTSLKSNKWREIKDYANMSGVDTQIQATLNDGTVITHSAAEWHQMIYIDESNLCLSANGTLFRTDQEGIIPGLLARWYSERVELRKIASKLKKEFQRMEKNGDPKAEVDKVKADYAFYDKRQLISKIKLNSLYGALLNEHCRYFDQRLGQSTTLTGRCIAKHMSAKVNEMFTGDYGHLGDSIVYGDTDSVIGSTLIDTINGMVKIEDLFNTCNSYSEINDKEYAYDNKLQVLSYDDKSKKPYYGNINYIYRHNVTKDLYEIEDENGNKVTVTEDHSVMVERDDVLIEVKPTELNGGDILICINQPK